MREYYDWRKVCQRLFLTFFHYILCYAWRAGVSGRRPDHTALILRIACACKKRVPKSLRMLAFARSSLPRGHSKRVCVNVPGEDRHERMRVRRPGRAGVVAASMADTLTHVQRTIAPLRASERWRVWWTEIFPRACVVDGKSNRLRLSNSVQLCKFARRG